METAPVDNNADQAAASFARPPKLTKPLKEIRDKPLKSTTPLGVEDALSFDMVVGGYTCAVSTRIC